MPQTPADADFEQARDHFLEGLRCFQAGDWPAAERHYMASLQRMPGRPSTLINLAATRLRMGRPAEALAHADAALAAEGDSSDALLHRATALAQLDRPEEALAAYDRLLAIDPALHPAWSSRGSLLRELHRPQEAAAAFREALRLGADPALHAYYLAAVDDAAPPLRAPAVYVQELFDQYAGEFEDHLVGQLRYQGHRRLVDGLAGLGFPATSGAPGTPGTPDLPTRSRIFESALDIGCGTGLCGPLVRSMTRRLTGVDLSGGMLEKAAALGVYDALHQAEVVAHLQQVVADRNERHDLVLAADVFIYIGDLEPVFAAIAALMDRGIFCFTVEVADAMAPPYRLLPSLRYAHSRHYLLALAAAHGFEPVALHTAPVREDQRSPVDALYVYLRRGGYDPAP